MNFLLELRDSDIFPQASDLDASDFLERKAARAIVTNALGQVALLKVGNHNYHKLPGGGIEGQEDTEQALRREVREEIGCEITITNEVGEIIEYKSEQKKKQISYCYRAQQAGELDPPEFTEEEIADGFEIIWLKNIDAAIDTIEQDRPNNYTGRFIQARDLAFLKAAKQLES